MELVLISKCRARILISIINIRLSFLARPVAKDFSERTVLIKKSFCSGWETFIDFSYIAGEYYFDYLKPVEI